MARIGETLRIIPYTISDTIYTVLINQQIPTIVVQEYDTNPLMAALRFIITHFQLYEFTIEDWSTF